MSRLFFYLILILVVILACSQQARADWHVNWENWSFDYGVNGHAGLELHNVRLNNELVIHKASFPVLRVDYEPPICHQSFFSDLFSWCNLIPRSSIIECPSSGTFVRGNSWCGQKICVREYTAANRTWFEIGITGTEGNYLVYQAWYFSKDGRMMARAYSKGEQCANATHTHHPYWRFDFDIRQAADNQVYRYDDSGAFTQYAVEKNDVKGPHARSWFVRDAFTGYHGVWMIPGQVNGRNDGQSTSFSDRDVSVRLYHPNEEGPWMDHVQGKKEVEYDLPAEAIQSADIVFWYVAHFQHVEPLPPFNPNKPCGDPAFPPVFVLKDSNDCNDVFGAGPTLQFVRSFDFSIGLNLQPRCVIGPVPGGIVKFSSKVRDITPVPPGPGDQPTFQWSVSGSGALPKNPLRTTESDFEVKLGNSPGPIDVTVVVRLRGITKIETLRVVPDTEEIARVKSASCERIARFVTLLNQARTLSIPFINPLGPDDPLRFFVSHPYSARTLAHLRVSFSNMLIETAGLIALQERGARLRRLRFLVNRPYSHDELLQIQRLLRQSIEQANNLLTP